MRWIGISGSWRNTNQEMERDVRSDVGAIIDRGDGIVTGGALGVDYFATDEALKRNPDCSNIKIILPVPFDLFVGHLQRRVGEGVVTAEQIEPNLSLIRTVRNIRPASIVEMDQHVCNEQTYYARNTEVVNAADELWAYRANDSMGTGDAIDKAMARGIPVHIKAYRIQA